MATKDGYVVRKVDPDDADTKRQETVESVRYPPGCAAHERVVVSELELWQVEANIGGYFSLSYWKSLLNRKEDYTVVIRQTDYEDSEEDERVHFFVLYESPSLEDARDAFRVLRGTLEPLVDDCTVVLTEGILKELVLPSPQSAQHLIFHLVEVMERNSDAHPDWVSVLQAIATPALRTADEEAVEAVYRRFEGEAVNRAGDSFLHKTASAGSGKATKTLLERELEGKTGSEKEQVLEKKNKEGRTSLHLAFQSNNRETVQELVKAGANLTTEDDTDGSNPLHLAAERDAATSISAAYNRKYGFLFSEAPDNPQHIKLLDALNSRNKKGFTPLMLAVCNDYIQSAMSLLLADADPNISHTESGNTALHFAAEQGNKTMVKMLITFYGDIKAKNRSGQMPLDLAKASSAKGADKCIKTLKETLELKEKAEQLSTDFHPFPTPQDTKFLLSIDGGGSRSVISCLMLIALRRRMKELQPHCAPLHHHFDYLAGTSGGAILGLGLTHANATPELARSLCLKCSEDVCSGTPTFSPESMEEYLKEAYGEELEMASCEKPRIMVTTVEADKSPTKLRLFRNYGELKDNRKVWECARASSAAPVYFTPFEGKYIDGGVMANNPTLDAMVEIFAQGKRENEEVKIGLVLSIGTGIPPADEAGSTEIYIPRISNILSSLLSLPSTIASLSNLIQVFITQSTQSDGQETRRARAWCSSIGAAYHRWSPPLGRVYDMAESDKKELTRLMYEAHLHILENFEEIDQVARLLLSRGVSK